MDLMSSVTTSSATPDRRTAPAGRWLVLVVVAVAQLMLVLDATIMNNAPTSAQLALGFSNSDRQWVATAYALSFGSLLLVGGRLGDMFSRKWVFIMGLVGFATASAIRGAAGSFVVLVTARAQQGAFGAVLAPSALGTLVSAFNDPRERGRGLRRLRLDRGRRRRRRADPGRGAYRVPLVALVPVYQPRVRRDRRGRRPGLHSQRPASQPSMDWPGAVLAGAVLFAIVFGFSHAETAGWTAALTLGSLVGGVVLLAGFVLAERRVRHPLLPLRVIVDRTPSCTKSGQQPRPGDLVHLRSRLVAAHQRSLRRLHQLVSRQGLSRSGGIHNQR
jgi:MFS family permease